jgi:hypothetical protein
MKHIDDKSQFVDGPYPERHRRLDCYDALRFVTRDMLKIANGEVPMLQQRVFAEESIKGLKMFTFNSLKP